MPCIKCNNDKWRIGSGRCVFKTLTACKKALAAIHAIKSFFSFKRKAK